MNKTIDYVFPYVDCDDPSWVEEYNKYVPKDKTKRSGWSTGMQRFRSNDLLKYVFRSIEKNMPFIRKVHLLVMSDSQVPDWVDREKVHVVLHKDFIPEEFLPTFNSNTIESFLANIPGLSERFIYGNDDLFITSKCAATDFFKVMTPKYEVIKRKYTPSAPGDQLRLDDQKLILGTSGKDVYEVQHICMPYCLSTIKEVAEKYNDEIMASVGKFRAPGQYNQWIYSLYQRKYKTQINKGIHYLSTEIRPNTRKRYDCDWSKYKAVCLNDSSETTQKDLKIVKQRLDKMFPNTSRFEKQKPKPVKKEEPKQPVKKPRQTPLKKRIITPSKSRPIRNGWGTFFY